MFHQFGHLFRRSFLYIYLAWGMLNILDPWVRVSIRFGEFQLLFLKVFSSACLFLSPSYSNYMDMDFLAGPVVKTPCFHCRRHRFNPWLGKFHMPFSVAKNSKIKNKEGIVSRGWGEERMGSDCLKKLHVHWKLGFIPCLLIIYSFFYLFLSFLLFQ